MRGQRHAPAALEWGKVCVTHGTGSGRVRKILHSPGFDSRIIQLVSVGKPGGKKEFGRPRLRGEDNIKTDLQEMKLRHGQDLSGEGLAQVVGS